MKHDHPDSADPRPEHLRAWEALPWVVNGRATPEQARWVADHVAGCDDCRAELAWQQRLHDALAAPADTSATTDPATEAGLQRLLARLDDAVEEQPALALPATTAAPRSHRLTWALAAAVVVQAIGLGVMSLQLGGNVETSYRTLSEVPGSSAPTATLRVLPDSTMTLAQWQALLQALELQVVGGPNASGAYALAPLPGATALPREGALARLRASPGIRLVEPIGNAP